MRFFLCVAFLMLCVLSHHPSVGNAVSSTTDSILYFPFLFFSSVLPFVFSFVIWSCLFPVCAVLCVNCFRACIAACAMQQLAFPKACSLLQATTWCNTINAEFTFWHNTLLFFQERTQGHDTRTYHGTIMCVFSMSLFSASYNLSQVS